MIRLFIILTYIAFALTTFAQAQDLKKLPGFQGLEIRTGANSVILRWQEGKDDNIPGYDIYRSTRADGPYTRLNEVPLQRTSYVDFDVVNAQTYYYQIEGIDIAGAPGSVLFSASARPEALDDSLFLDLLQRTAFDFFWNEANPDNGLIKDRDTPNAACSIASVGFGLTAICVAIDRDWITREAGRQRVLTTLTTFWHKPQGRTAAGTIGYKGFFYHFLDMTTGLRAWNSELSSIDTALLLAGIIYAKQYFTGDHPAETSIRQLADSIYYRVDWQWMRNYQPNITLGWFPDTGFINAWWRGYNEAMIMGILALGSPTHPVPASTWNAWTGGYAWKSHYGYDYVEFPPLFGHQFSHCWIDFRKIQDAYMRNRGITYFDNSCRATLAQRAYCIANPGNFVGYGENVWGLTACDGHNGYKARGAPPPQDDDGTIAPTAAASSMPFTPKESLAAVKHLYDTYRQSIWTQYGFCDAFNLTVNWWAPGVIGIDEGPIVLMIENYRSQKIWQLFMENLDIQRGLERAGFAATTSHAGTESGNRPNKYGLSQNYPNPFNSSTTIRYYLPQTTKVVLKVYNRLGNEITTLVNGIKPTGTHSVLFSGADYASGVYFYQLETNNFIAVKKMMILD